MKRPVAILFLFVAVQSAFTQVANTTVEYFFNSNATLWDLADIRLGRYSDKGDEYNLIDDSFLNFDFDSGVFVLLGSLDLACDYRDTSCERWLRRGHKQVI